MQDKRTEWRESLTPDMVNHLVFLDESGVNIDLTRRYGRARSNCPVVDSTPLNTPRTQTVLAAIRVDGTIIPTTYEGGTTGDVFVNYLKDTLLPALRPGDIIIMDNLRSHHVARVAQVLADSGHEALYLPPYSPDLNPIEMLWSKLKAILRKWKVRVYALLPKMILKALALVSVKDCRDWFAKDGYCPLF